MGGKQTQGFPSVIPFRCCRLLSAKRVASAAASYRLLPAACCLPRDPVSLLRHRSFTTRARTSWWLLLLPVAMMTYAVWNLNH